MKILFTIFIVFIIEFSYSQNIEIEYMVTTNTNDGVSSTSINYKLKIKKEQSVYYNSNDSLKQFKYESFIEDTKKIGELTRVKLDDNHYAFVKQDLFYKNYERDTLIFNEIILNKKVFVGEKINLFNWEIVPKSDTLILNQKCQKAITTFRGRKYEAFFSNEISTYGGPWKFDGLPGLILSVKSLDDYFIINPIKITLNSKKENEIFNPYLRETVLNWTQYREETINAMKRTLRYLKSISEDGEDGSIEITDKIEDLKIPKMKF